jgi:hypothetical protein
VNDLQPGTTMYRITELEQAVYDLRQEIRNLRDGIAMLSGELADAWTRIAELQNPEVAR